MKIILDSSRPVSGGEEIELTFLIEDGGYREKKKLTVATQFYTEQGLPTDIRESIELDAFRYDELEALAEKSEAIKRGLYILSFGDNSARTLSRKLVIKGFSRDAAEAAAEYLSENGFINEEASASAALCDMAEKKLYGARRIRAHLYEKGFSKEAIESAFESADVDFAHICASRVEKMRTDFSDEAERKKAVAALVRYGFTFDEIKYAIKQKSRS